MTKEQLEQYDHQKTIDMYEDYKAGRIDFKTYSTYMIDVLENFIKKIISTKHRTVSAEYSDLMHDGYVGIMEQLDKYDPYQSMPTSYFSFYISSATKNSTKNNMSGHYVAKAYQLDKAMKDLGYTGLSDENAPDDIAVKLSSMTGIPLTTIKATIQYYERSTSSWEVQTDNTLVNCQHKDFENPELLYQETARKQFIMEEFEKLSPLEQLVLWNLEIADKDERMSARALISKFKEEAFRAEYDDELKGRQVDQAVINKIMATAKHKLRHNKKLSRFISDKIDDVYEEIDEQDDTDIVNFLDNLEDL